MTSSMSPPLRRKRPRRVTLFALAVLYLGVVNLIRAWLIWSDLSFEWTLPLTSPLAYLAVCGLVWGVTFAVSASGLWKLWPWSRILAMSAIVLYQGHIWINHLIFDASLYSHQVWLFHTGVSVVWIAGVWVFLSLPGIRQLYHSKQ